MLSFKDSSDFKLLEKTAEITTYFFSEFIADLELYLDDGEKITHQSISKKMEDKLEKLKKKSLKEKF